MRIFIFVHNHAGIEQSLRINGLLNLQHDFISNATPFRYYKRGHVTPCTVLRLQGAFIFLYHKRHYLFYKLVIADYLVLFIEGLGHDKMNITVFGVAENDGIEVSIFAEEPLQVYNSITQFLHRKGNVFQDNRGTAGPNGAYSGKK